MKNILLLVCIVLSYNVQSLAQCPGCVPVDCSAQNPDGGLCDTIIIGMANHPLDERISFYMPGEVYTTLLPGGGGFVQLDKIKVTGITGMPLGLEWESNKSPVNEYFPSSGDTMGCVRICGTPLQPDTFHLTVYLLADVTADLGIGPISVPNNSQTYDNAVIIILPDTAGGVSSFSIDPNISTSCDPLTLSFEAKLDGSPNPTEYDWNFGNGNTAVGKIPADQTFVIPDIYPVTLTTTIKAYVINEFKVLTASGWYPDIEEVTAIQAPDLYFKIPTLGYQSTEKTETQPPVTWSNLHIVVPAGVDSLDIEVWDADTNVPIFGSPDDQLVATKIRLSVNQLAWSGANAAGSISIGDTIGNQFTETLNITIGAIPQASINVSLGRDTICSDDSTTLFLEGTELDNIIWFKDSVLIPNATDTFFIAKESGVYQAEIISNIGCRGYSDQQIIKVHNVPQVPVLSYNANSNELRATGLFGGNYFQWFVNGDSIPGATTSIIVLNSPGTYTVAYASAFGCTVFSDPFLFTSSIGNIYTPELNVNIYPNPNHGNFMLEIQGIDSRIDIKVFNGLAQEVYREKLLLEVNGYYKKSYDLSALKNGVYFIEVVSEKSKIIKRVAILE